MMKFPIGALRAALLLCAAVSVCGCATITRGTDDAWVVKTEPSGAQVRTSMGNACDQTPCVFKMSRKSEFDVTITKPGYVAYHGHVSHHTAQAGAAGFVGNALLGGVFGAGMDIATGATQDLQPNPLLVTLQREPDPAPPAPVAEK